jgi:hypothetical protein
LALAGLRAASPSRGRAFRQHIGQLLLRCLNSGIHVLATSVPVTRLVNPDSPPHRGLCNCKNRMVKSNTVCARGGSAVPHAGVDKIDDLVACAYGFRYLYGSEIQELVVDWAPSCGRSASVKWTSPSAPASIHRGRSFTHGNCTSLSVSPIATP